MTTTSKFYNVTEEEYATWGELYGYTDKEFEMVHDARQMIRAGEELRAMAAQDASRRKSALKDTE